jgi:pimeloyl-ACP methyl ester carboxylesterase
VRRAHFVGNSWGGMVGAMFAALYPERIASAVLMNCTASPAVQTIWPSHGSVFQSLRIPRRIFMKGKALDRLRLSWGWMVLMLSSVGYRTP